MNEGNIYSSHLLSMLRTFFFFLPKSSPLPAEDDVIISHLIRQIPSLSRLLQMESRAEWSQTLNNPHRERGLNQIVGGDWQRI